MKIKQIKINQSLNIIIKIILITFLQKTKLIKKKRMTKKK